MKTLIVTFFAVAFSAGAFAQDQDQNNILIMKDQKVLIIKDGQKSVLMQDTTFANGTVVMVNGSVKSADGTTVVLKDGEFVKSDGTVGKPWKEEKTEPAKQDSSSNQ